MIHVAHLLDDFAMGGVTRALTLFEEPALTRISTSKVFPVSPDAILAPRTDAELIIDHMALSWKRLLFLASLRMRNPKSRIVHVEHSYTRGFEQANVASKARFRSMLKIASFLVDEIICVSKAQRDWLANCVGIATIKLSTIYPWTDRKELFQIPPVVRSKPRPIRLLAYGRYARVKNFEALIEAMRMLPNNVAELTLFGGGPDRAKLEAQAAELANVRVYGSCASPAEYLTQCDAVIIPSRHEAFGLVATEARMAARAVLASDVDGLPEQIGDCGLVASMSSAEEIAFAIRKIAQLDLAKLGINGRVEVGGQADMIIEGWKHQLRRAQP